MFCDSQESVGPRSSEGVTVPLAIAGAPPPCVSCSGRTQVWAVNLSSFQSTIRFHVPSFPFVIVVSVPLGNSTNDRMGAKSTGWPFGGAWPCQSSAFMHGTAAAGTVEELTYPH